MAKSPSAVVDVLSCNDMSPRFGQIFGLRLRSSRYVFSSDEIQKALNLDHG